MNHGSESKDTNEQLIKRSKVSKLVKVTPEQGVDLHDNKPVQKKNLEFFDYVPERTERTLNPPLHQ